MLRRPHKLDEVLTERATGSDEEHDAVFDLVAFLKEKRIDQAMLGMTGDAYLKKIGMVARRRPRILPPEPEEYGWVGPPPWSPLKWREDRAKLRGDR